MEQFIFGIENRARNSEGDDIITIDGNEHFHLARVLRLKVGEKIFATDGIGTTCLCIVRRIEKGKSICEVIEEYHNLNSSLRECCIGLSVLKPISKLEFAIEKCTELGASRLVLFNSERSKKASLRSDRLKSIVISAVKQSLQSKIPELAIEKDLENVASQSYVYEEKFVLHEKSNDMVNDYLLGLKKSSSVIALVGPEGGFSDAEVDFLIGKGFKSFSVGKSRLKSETAAIKIASLLAVY
ncbi:MAG: RsmE family RNA methyltransferase [Candidatus Kryptoniota bacterium]